MAPFLSPFHVPEKSYPPQEFCPLKSEAQKANLLHPSCAACATSAMESPLSVHGKPRAASRTSCSPSGQCSRQAPRSRTKHGNPNRAEPNEKQQFRAALATLSAVKEAAPDEPPTRLVIVRPGMIKAHARASLELVPWGTLGQNSRALVNPPECLQITIWRHMRLGPRRWSGPNRPA